MIPAGTLPMCLGPSLQGDIPGTSHAFLTSAGLPGVRPLPGPLLRSLGCPLCLLHSSCFPFISWLHGLQRAWEFFSSEAVISIIHSWQFSCRMGVFLLQPPPACSWIASGRVHGSWSSEHVTPPEPNSFLGCRGGHQLHTSFRALEIPPALPPTPNLRWNTI